MWVIDTINTPGGMDLLVNKYGIRKVPVLARDDKTAMGQMLEPFAKLAGLPMPGVKRLTPAELYAKQQVIFATAQRLIRQFPQEALGERVIPHRPRLIRTLSYHIFRIGEAFLETWAGAEYALRIADNEPPDEMRTGEDIAQYGESMVKRYQAWWSSVEDRSLPQMLKTYYGDTEAFRVYERVTWHSAQHSRHLAAVLERMEIPPDHPLTAEQLAGLPMPERLWE